MRIDFFRRARPAAAVPRLVDPNSVDLEALNVSGLLGLHARIGSVLRDRGVVRSGNNPVGDYAEYLFARAFGWSLVTNSTAAYDAVDGTGVRYQIKARRLIGRSRASQQLGSVRNLEQRGFDCLAVVLFAENYDVHSAFIAPYEVAAPLMVYRKHTNSSTLVLTESHWRLEGIRIVTDDLRLAAT